MKFVETHLGKGMDGNITAHHRSSERTGGHAGVCEERPPSCKPLPRHPSAEPALQPLNWSFDSLSAQESFFFGGVVCLNTHTHTPIVKGILANLAGSQNQFQKATRNIEASEFTCAHPGA